MSFRLPAVGVTIGKRYFGPGEVDMISASLDSELVITGQPMGEISLRFWKSGAADAAMDETRAVKHSRVPFRVHLLRSGEVLDYGRVKVEVDRSCGRSVVIPIYRMPIRKMQSKGTA